MRYVPTVSPDVRVYVSLESVTAKPEIAPDSVLVKVGSADPTTFDLSAAVTVIGALVIFAVGDGCVS